MREPIALISGVPRDGPADASAARRIDTRDLKAGRRICRRVHEFDRTAELADALEDRDRTPLLISRGGRIVAYSSGFGTFGHAVADTDTDMQELILAAGGDRGRAPLECLVPMRCAQLLNWALDQGFAIVKTMNLMTSGDLHRTSR